MMTINHDGVAKITNSKDEVAQVKVIKQVVNEALNLQEGTLNLWSHHIEQERKSTFLHVPRQVNNFKDLVVT